ncbi:hypothetical protein D3C71_1646080 [compost metagenome]
MPRPKNAASSQRRARGVDMSRGIIFPVACVAPPRLTNHQHSNATPAGKAQAASASGHPARCAITGEATLATAAPPMIAVE